MERKVPPSTQLTGVQLPADDFAWERLNNDLRTIGEILDEFDRRISALADEVEKLRAAVPVRDDESTAE